MPDLSQRDLLIAKLGALGGKPIFKPLSEVERQEISGQLWANSQHKTGQFSANEREREQWKDAT